MIVDKFKKKFVASIAVLTFVSSIFVYSTVSAGSWSSSVAFLKPPNGSSGSYAPDNGNTSFYRYYDTNGVLKVSPKTSWHFTQSEVDAIQNYWDLYDYYYTMDISIVDPEAGSGKDGSFSAFNAFYSNLPGAKFDIDDDPEPNGNGANDETEVTATEYGSPLVVDYDYRFETYFYVYNENDNTDRFVWTSQMSMYDPYTGEWNVGLAGTIRLFSEHLSRSYPW
ncbi:MAG: hypothetical protein ACQEXQ_14100 [Bacillota bacterium]